MIAINTEHHEYRARKAMLQQYRDLYTGGAQFKAQAGNYLLKRLKEPLDVYQERLDRAFYENYIGSIVDWYAATLFRREPVISIEGENDRARQFYSRFVENCDRKGTNLSDYFRKQMQDAMVCGVSYTLLDFPRNHGKVCSRAAEDELGSSRAYLVHYGPEEVINWSANPDGEYEWVVIRTQQLRRERLEDPEPLLETRWQYYDRERFATYVRRNRSGLFGENDREAPIELESEGLHGLAKMRRVPLIETRVSDGMWLLNKASQLQLEHFNKSNALSWALTMGLFAMPVVYSERDWSKVVGESYYIQLAPGDRFGWTEPEGHVYQIAAENLNRLKEEIFRVCYVLSMAGPTAGDGRPISGLSKQRDFAVTQEVLRAFGDTAKDAIRRILNLVEQAREDGLQISVSGLDEFDIGDFSSEVDDARKLLDMGVGSKTLQRLVYKKLAFKYLCDERQELKDAIAREIEDWMAREQE